MDLGKPKRTIRVKKKFEEIDGPKKKGFAKVGNMVRTLNKSLSRSNTQSQSSLIKKQEKGTNENDTEELYEDPTYAEFSGPQLKINKNYLSFIEKVGNLSKDSITVTNNGSTAIYYRWKNLDKQSYFDSAIFDKEERFLCHANKNVIKPSEIKTFNFTFKSRCTGIFEEDWTLECEPPLINPLPTIKLSGHAIQDDPNIEWRNEVDMILDARHKHRFVSEIINDIVGQVRTPTPPLPDLEDPEVCKREFEEKNAKYHVYYTPLVMKLYRNLQALIYEELHMRVEDTYWDLNIDFLFELINKVRENSVRENLERRLNDLLVIAKKRPIDRSPIFTHMKDALRKLLNDLPVTVNNVRREKEIMEVQFFEPIDMTPEEQKKRTDEENKAKAEFAKKQKKKPKNEEEERKIYEEYRAQLGPQLIQQFTQQATLLEENDSLVRVLSEINTIKRPTKEYFEALSMKRNMKDFDIEEKRILLKVHIKTNPKVVPVLTEEEIAAQIEAEKALNEAKAKEEQKQAKAGGARKTRKTKEEIEQEQARQKEDEARKDFIESLEEKSLFEAVNVIKMCLEQLAKLVIVLVSFGEPNGRKTPSTSVKYFWEYMVNQLDQICKYEDTCKLEELQEKIDGEVYPGNSAVILENVFHEPEETGYIYQEDNTLLKLDNSQIQEFANHLSTYAPVYIIEDKYNLYKDYTTMTKIKTELTMFGPLLSNDIYLTAQAFLHCAYEPKKSSNRRKAQKAVETHVHKKSLAVIGGEFSGELILALNTILNFYDEVYLMGKVGVLFLMHRLGFNKFGTYTLDPSKTKLIEKILAIAAELGKEIHVPEKLIVAPNPEATEDKLHEWLSSIYNTRFIWPDNYEQYKEALAAEKAQVVEEQVSKKQEPTKKTDTKNPKTETLQKNKTLEELPQEETLTGNRLGTNFTILGFEQSFLDQIEKELDNARSIFWVGSLDPILRPGLNDANRSLAMTIHEVKEEKKSPSTQQGGVPVDWLVTCVGEDLIEAMNQFDLVVDQQPATAQSKKEETMSETETMHDDANMSKGGGDEATSKGTRVDKRNNIGTIADAYGGNTSFVLNLISGRHLETLDIITNIEKKNEDEEEEDFSFIDEI